MIGRGRGLVVTLPIVPTAVPSGETESQTVEPTSTPESTPHTRHHVAAHSRRTHAHTGGGWRCDGLRDYAGCRISVLALRSWTGVLPVAGFPLSSSGFDCDKKLATRAPVYSGIKVRLGLDSGSTRRRRRTGLTASVNTDSTGVRQSGLCY